MKILYAAFRHDPQDPSKRQGADQQFLEALQSNGFDCQVVGPFMNQPCFIERVVRRLVKSLTGKSYLKYDLTNTFRASRAVSKAAQAEKPEVVFSLYPAPLAFYRGTAPCVFRTDATILGVLLDAPEFLNLSVLVRYVGLWLEKRALNNCLLVVTHSTWSQDTLIRDYGLSDDRILVFPNPSPFHLKHLQADLIKKDLAFKPLLLLFVGQDARRKGLDVALQVVESLNRAGLNCVLKIVGVSGASTATIHYLGKLQLNDPEQLSLYETLLQEAHFLLHPALFDPAPRVTSEAAAFGTPTITNNTGGLATSVKDGVSGIVLPKGSPLEAYVKAITDLVNDPVRYQTLCQTTRQRYEQELNWDVAGKRLVQVMEEAVRKHQARSSSHKNPIVR